MFKVGVMIESFRLGLWPGLEAAAQLGADGVQLYATAGESHFAKLDGPMRARLLQTARDLKLEYAAICGDFGGKAFHDASGNQARIEDSKRVMELALELDCRVVTTHAGTIPDDPRHERYLTMARAFAQMGRFAVEQGATFAIETGPETAAILARFLQDLDIPGGVGVNFDPANLAMVCREDIPRAVATLGPWIVHTHAKDGINLQPFNPEDFYGPAKTSGVKWGDYFREVPLGQGQVPFPAYLTALTEAGYSGYLTIEREVGGNPTADIATAVNYLRNLP